MFNTNDIYNEAVKDAIINEEEKRTKSLSFYKLFFLLIISFGLIGGAAYYFKILSVDKSLIIQNQDIVGQKAVATDKDYIHALSSIENELMQSESTLLASTKTQKDLSEAINDLVMDNTKEKSSYIKELENEVAGEAEVRERTIIVKKGDTLRSISNKFYGNSMDYKRIIASNDVLKNDTTIYEGQMIILPYE